VSRYPGLSPVGPTRAVGRSRPARRQRATR
jgi:hypothetical protein